MKANFIIVAIALGLLVIGIYEAIYNGIAASYWLLMLAGGLFFWVNLRINSSDSRGKNQDRKNP